MAEHVKIRFPVIAALSLSAAVCLTLFLNKFYLGIPMLLPRKIKYFNYKSLSKTNMFKIDKKIIAKKIFITNKINYKPLKHFFSYGNQFCSDVSLKNKYRNYVYKIVAFNTKIKEDKHERISENECKIINDDVIFCCLSI